MSDSLTELRDKLKVQGWLLKADVEKFKLELQAKIAAERVKNQLDDLGDNAKAMADDTRKSVDDFFASVQDAADTNGDGKVTVADLQHSLDNAGDDVKEHVKDLLK